MPKAEKVCLKLRNYENVHKNFNKIVDSWESMTRVPKVEKEWGSAPKVEKVWASMPKLEKVCQKLIKYAWSWESARKLRLRNLDEVCKNLRKCAKSWKSTPEVEKVQ